MDLGVARRAVAGQGQHTGSQASSGHGSAVADLALGCDVGQIAVLLRLGHEGDVGMAAVDKGLHGQPRAHLVVVVDRVIALRGRFVMAHNDNGNLAGVMLHRLTRDLAGDQDQAVHPVVDHLFDQRDLGPGAGGADADHDLVTG